MPDFDKGDDHKKNSHFKSKDKIKQWKKNGNIHTVVDEGNTGKGRQTENSNGMEKGGKFKGCFICSRPNHVQVTPQ